MSIEGLMKPYYKYRGEVPANTDITQLEAGCWYLLVCGKQDPLTMPNKDASGWLLVDGSSPSASVLKFYEAYSGKVYVKFTIYGNWTTWKQLT